jgi:catechol 2,3-dioxygenase-like lactoylglutathione lyase family enzyme
MDGMTDPSLPHAPAVRVARPTNSLVAAQAFYVDLLGFPVLSKFDDHDGFSGLIVGLPSKGLQLEFLYGPGGRPKPTPTPEDLLVLYLADQRRTALTTRLQQAGHSPLSPANPYWDRIGAFVFADPDGYLLVIAPV